MLFLMSDVPGTPHLSLHHGRSPLIHAALSSRRHSLGLMLGVSAAPRCIRVKWALRSPCRLPFADTLRPTGSCFHRSVQLRERCSGATSSGTAARGKAWSFARTPAAPKSTCVLSNRTLQTSGRGREVSPGPAHMPRPHFPTQV